MARVLLLVPSSTYRAADFIQAACGLGAEVVVASDAMDALTPLLSLRPPKVDCSQPELAAAAIEEFARQAPLNAVVAVDDQGILAAAMACARLGLPHNPPEAVAATRNKAAMRRALMGTGVPQPDFQVVSASDEVARLAREVGLPCVVKPVSLSGSRGVIRADTVGQAVAAASRARKILEAAGEDAAGPLLIEEYVPGDEVAVEGLLHGGELEILAIFDKPDPLEGPYFEETIYTTPSRLPSSSQEDVRDVVARAARALGLREGPVHAEARIRGGRACLLEIAARSIGGLCSRTLQYGLGVSEEELILRHALGLSLDVIRRRDSAAGVMMLPIPADGVLAGVRGREEALATPGIIGLEITIPAGSPVRPLPEGDRYLGFLFARAETPDRVERALRDAHARLEFDIRPPVGG